jgi:hypothetical protein
MKQNILLSLFFALLAILTGYITYQTSSTSSSNIVRMYSGYLVCQSCAGARNGIAMDGVNVLKHPELHTVNCLKMPSCANSGLGIFIKRQTNQYSYYKFDKADSELALKGIIAKTAKVDHMLVEVTGKLKGRTIHVERIVEK